MKGRAFVQSEHIALRLHSWARGFGLRVWLESMSNGFAVTWEPAT